MEILPVPSIPNMKLEKHIVQRRVDLLATEGVHFKPGTEIGRDISAMDLREQFDAIVDPEKMLGPEA